MKTIVSILVISGLICVAFCVVSCQERPPASPVNIATQAGDRFKVEIVQSFNDDSAYQHFRNIYIITDRKTGKEYVGVSGVGIAEQGTHPAGKTVAPDER